jgi:hypothetical protein
MHRLRAPAVLLGLFAATLGLGCGDDALAGRAGGAGGAGGAGTSAAATSNASTSTGTTATLVATAGLTLSEVALYQAVKRPLMAAGGPAVSAIPIVAGRDALLRVFVDVGPEYDGSPVTAELALASGSVLQVTQALTGSSSDDDLTSTLNFELPGESIDATFAYRVTLGRPAAPGEQGSPLVYPNTAFEAAPASDAGSALHVELVPLLYAADGSNRAPDTSPEQLALIRDHLFGVFPVPDVVLTQHSPVSYPSLVQASGAGWQDLIDFMAALRAADAPAYEVYYFGLVSPVDTLAAYCNPSCTVGKAREGPVHDPDFRVAVGVGFSGDHTALTVRHELGHSLGREHAPCKATDNLDPSYPHADGSTGVWGYDLMTGTLVPPEMPDMMGNCKPTWVSGYTFEALFARMVAVNAAKP